MPDAPFGDAAPGVPWLSERGVVLPRNDAHPDLKGPTMAKKPGKPAPKPMPKPMPPKKPCRP